MAAFKPAPPPISSPEDEVKNRQTAMTKMSAIGRRYFELIEFDGNEELICEIRKHPIGLLWINIVGGFFGLVILTMIIYVAGLDTGMLGFDISSMKLPIIAVLLLLLIFDLIVSAIGTLIYKSNVIYVTNEKIAQVIYQTIIDRKISQLSIGDVQDVSATQRGLLSRLFNYGTLVIETAGEQQNYTFTFVPYPYQVSRAIVAAHEKYVALYGN